MIIVAFYRKGNSLIGDPKDKYDVEISIIIGFIAISLYYCFGVCLFVLVFLYTSLVG